MIGRCNKYHTAEEKDRNRYCNLEMIDLSFESIEKTSDDLNQKLSLERKKRSSQLQLILSFSFSRKLQLKIFPERANIRCKLQPLANVKAVLCP